MTFRLKDRVIDKWYPDAGIGIVKRVLKTRIHVLFKKMPEVCSLRRAWRDDKIVVYDKSHYKFLMKLLEYDY